MAKEWIVVTFETEYDALQFADLCKKAKIEGRLMPIPRKLSAGCGISWRSEAFLEQTIQALNKQHEADISCGIVKIKL